MQCKVLKDREGRALATVLRSRELKGPFSSNIRLTVEFIRLIGFHHDKEDEIVVRFTRRNNKNKRPNKPKFWKLAALLKRREKGLLGFKEFAESLGSDAELPGAELIDAVEKLAKTLNNC